ncbi:MFS transporter [Saccharopolyspora sp. HNM0983]|uniref:MFS transporter n=1 Tax=Saccharopolyspora montiporae TaxID=2781240 RepID=A0A929BCR9_9PSEU|nr:MFS transporter [Saccharopolyspora sp. HNM0983]MBE9375228.1 MFS transporter [Saccharopolyspora sp. HNM0983]
MQTNPVPTAHVPPGTRWGYAAGSLATGAFTTVPGLLMLPYLTDTMAVPAGAAGLIVLVPKIWDVVFNPVAGRISDGELLARGSRARGLLLGGTLLAVLFGTLFAGPQLGSPGAGAAYVTGVFFLTATAFAFFQVPFNALPAELTADYHERTRLTSTRIALLALAVLLSGALAPLVVEALGGAAGYRLMGVLVAVLMLTGVLSVYFGIRNRPFAPTGQAPRLRELVAALRGWRVFRRLLVVFVLQAMGIGVLLASVNYVARYVLGDPGLQSVLFAGFVGPALVIMPLWARMGRSRGKVAGFQISSLMFGGALAILVFAETMPLALIFALIAVCGAGYAGVQTFPLAILPDLISAEEQRTGETKTGVAAGVWTAAETLGFALGPGIFGLVLSIGGYRSTTESLTAQPPSAVTAVLFGFSLLPAALILAPVPLLRRRVLEGR